MQITHKEVVRTYYVEDGKVNYKVVHHVWEPEPEWRVKHHPGTDGSWSVHSAQGIHAYARLCDPTKATHKRVVEAVRDMVNHAA